MHKPITSTISVLCLTLLLVGCKGGAGGGGGDIVATVNGESVSKDEYIAHLERKVQVLVNSSKGPVQANVAQPLNFQALNDMVNQKLLLQLAKQENVLPTDADVANELKYQISKRPDFVIALTGQGMSVTEIKGELLISWARHNLLSKGIKISDAQVDAFIKDNPKEFENHAQVSLTWVVVKDAATKAKVDSDLKTGQTFGIVARQYTVDPGGETYQSTEYDKFPPRMKTEVDKLAEGGTSGWLEDGGSSVKIHVEKKTPASPLEIKPWMKEEVKRSLAEQKGSAAIDIDKRLLNSRKSAVINITKVGLKEKFDALTKSLKEADMKNTTGNSKKSGSN